MKPIHLAIILLLTNIVVPTVPAQSRIKNINTGIDSTKSGFDVTSADSTAFIDSSAVTPVHADTLKPVFRSGIITDNVYSHQLKNSDLQNSDYRYTGNFISQLPFGFLNDLGSMGYINEPQLYGFGFDYIGFLSDDISINNRLVNSLDLHLVQSEAIDSLYALPLTRGFLINPDNNPVSVNFVTKDRIDPIPYTRIRYYQAPSDEGFIDAMFSAYISRRINLTVGLSNMSKSTSYENSDYGNWSGRLKLRYMLSNKLNILVNYNYSTTNTPLNGGVDFETLAAKYSGSALDEIFYDNNLATVNYSNRYLKQTYNSFNIQLLGNLLNNLPTTVTLYYNYGLTEYRQNEDTSLTNIVPIIENNSFETYGAQITQSFNSKYAFIDVTGNYERVKLISPNLSGSKSFNKLSASGIAGLKIFNNTIVPNVFAKLLLHDEHSYFGFGSDLAINFSDAVSLYGGIAGFAKPYSIYINNLIDNNKNSSKFYIVEAGLKYNTDNFKMNLSLVNIKEDDKPIAIGTALNDAEKNTTITGFNSDNTNRVALNLNGQFHVMKFLVTTNLSYNSLEKSNHNSIPQFTASGGLYYIDTLFNSNLHLKAGLNYYLYGHTDFYLYDFEKSLSYSYMYNSSNDIVSISDKMFDPTFRLDFFVAGTIQEYATLYFAYENLLNTNYFIVPYYPMPGRTIRFGFSWELFN